MRRLNSFIDTCGASCANCIMTSIPGNPRPTRRNDKVGFMELDSYMAP